MEYNDILLHGGQSGDRQRKLLNKLQSREIFSTSYIDKDCLYALGIYHSVFYMLDKLGLHDIFGRKEPTYERLTLEFLISLI